jgi:hypothetical protein
MHTSLYYSVTAHPDDGQARPKHVGATNGENIYHLCILLVFVSNILCKLIMYLCMNASVYAAPKCFHATDHSRYDVWRHTSLSACLL